MTQADEVLVRDLDGESVLLNLSSESYFGLDEIGTRMWNVLLSSPSIEAACATLLDEYDVTPAELREDVLRLVSDLAQAGLVDVRAA